jgi:hypothetical protein
MRRTLKGSMQNLRFIAAVIVAGVHDSLEKWRGLRAALKTQDEIHPSIKESRLIVCRQCPLYFNRFGLQTCGSPLPGGHRDEKGQPMGCFCDVNKKAGSAVNGWLYDHTRGETILCWPKNLNSFPYDDDEQ